ncbi:ROK family protein [Fibrobacter sp. UWEL]|uniref:ROK family protein n=1 Tax=Fibrobacter sp. UWEL TaxID=1896209 RepID=UPI0009132224|nr:ROK family protein [Fibrobacter sp. UWEL]SHK81691.1 Sugar kinase of the NBD/HSP70 family, may contain an N-terminal HTH domain [Fibrobacter sp. UWEL]
MVKEIHSSTEIKKINVASVKRAILEKGSATKPEVAELTGLSVVTCGAILNELAASGTIIEETQRLSNGGRPAVSYRFSENTGNALCAYMYKESDFCYLRYQIRDISGNIKDTGVIQEKSLSIDTLVDYIKKLCVPEKFIKVIVLGIQGCINNGVLEFSDFSNLIGINVSNKIQSATGITTIVENDMNTIALGYSKSDENTNVDNIAILFFPKGQTPAGGFVVDGNILRGSSNLAGELSFFPFNFKKESQRVAFSDIEYAQPIIGQLAVATTIFLDPSAIVITGGLSNEVNKEDIINVLKTSLNRSQLPDIKIQPMVESEYYTGLYSIALDHLI